MHSKDTNEIPILKTQETHLTGTSVWKPSFAERQPSWTDRLKDYLSITFKHKRMIRSISVVAFPILSLAFLGYYLLLRPAPDYDAISKLMVKAGWEFTDPQLTVEGQSRQSIRYDDIVNSEIEILKSRRVKERMISLLGLENVYGDLAGGSMEKSGMIESAIYRLDQSLLTTANRNIIQVSLKGNDPAWASNILNQLVQSYIQVRSEIYKDPKSAYFLEQKMNEYHRKLKESEQALEAFREKYQVYSLDEERSPLIQERMRLEATLVDTQDNIKILQQQLAFLESELNGIPESVPSDAQNAMVSQAESRLLALQMEERQLQNKYLQENPLILNVRDQIKFVQQFLKEQENKSKGSSLNSAYQDVRLQVIQTRAGLQANEIKKASLESQLDAVNKKTRLIDELKNNYHHLLRELQNNEQNYQTYQTRLEDIRIHDELDRRKMYSVTVLEPASIPLVQVNKQYSLYQYLALAIGMGLLGALGLALGTAILLEKSNRTVSTPHQAERLLEIPVLTTIPYKDQPVYRLE